ERSGSPDPLYTRWIGTYASTEFGSVVEAVLDCADALARHLKPAEREAMKRHFITASRYEWMFWDMGLRRETWPV
ncbi:MAG: thiaminase II, partial [Candidatus Rokuibacteriota bacterium]